MALKLLNPGLRPLGMFDLLDADTTQVVGGEYVELAAAGGGEVAAADVGQFAAPVLFARGDRTAVAAGPPAVHNLGGLCDDGNEDYGTLFGSLIGQNAGQATLFGTVGGAVVLGPRTTSGSGKVTIFATAGLYGVTQGTGAPDELLAAGANDILHANATSGLLGTTVVGESVAIYVGEMTDSSLVSTTNQAAGEAAGTEYHAIFYLGNAAQNPA